MCFPENMMSRLRVILLSKTGNTGRTTEDNKFSFKCVEFEMLLKSYVVSRFTI